MLEGLFNRTDLFKLKKSLDVAALRQKATAANISNAMTPGYRKMRVFSTELNAASGNGRGRGYLTNSDHIPLGLPKGKSGVHRVSDPPKPGKVNNVDIEEEMAHLAENHLFFNSAARLLSMRFDGLRSSIRGRSG